MTGQGIGEKDVFLLRARTDVVQGKRDARRRLPVADDHYVRRRWLATFQQCANNQYPTANTQYPISTITGYWILDICPFAVHYSPNALPPLLAAPVSGLFVYICTIHRTPLPTVSVLFCLKLRGFAKGRGPLRPLRGSGYALGQPDAFGAGASRYHYAFASHNTSTIN